MAAFAIPFVDVTALLVWSGLACTKSEFASGYVTCFVIFCYEYGVTNLPVIPRPPVVPEYDLEFSREV